MKRSQLIGKMVKLFLGLLLVYFSTSCEEGSLVEPIENVVGTITAEPLRVGDYSQGGIIVFLNDSGSHGLIAAVDDQSSSNPWWNGSFVQTDAVSALDGRSNTRKIISVQGSDKAYAAKLCADYQYDGYDDWFLPSKDQLEIIQQNKHLLDGLSNQIYWTSTEYEIGYVWVQNFSTGEQHLNNTSDQANVHTRAMREF